MQIVASSIADTAMNLMDFPQRGHLTRINISKFFTNFFNSSLLKFIISPILELVKFNGNLYFDIFAYLKEGDSSRTRSLRERDLVRRDLV